MRHLPPSLFWVSGVPASVSWWHFQPSFHPSEKWMAWQERYQMSCRASQWICHWVWHIPWVGLLPEWIMIYLYGFLIMLTDLLPSTPIPHPVVDRLTRSCGGSVGEALANVVWDPHELQHLRVWPQVPFSTSNGFPSFLFGGNEQYLAPQFLLTKLMLVSVYWRCDTEQYTWIYSKWNICITKEMSNSWIRCAETTNALFVHMSSSDYRADFNTFHTERVILFKWRKGNKGW